VRAVLAGGAVLLVDLALLSLSRGAVLSLPVVLVLFLALAPHRLRHLAVLAPVGLAVAATAPVVLDAGPALRAGVGELAAVDAALRAALAASVAVGLLVAVAVPLGRRWAAEDRFGPDTAGRARRAWAVAAPAGLAVAGVVLLAAVGNPATRAADAWESFRDGYEARGAVESRLGELGSNRSDFYRVALDAFAQEPVLGVGLDNYQAAYLRLGAARETPRYAHSWPLSVLAQLGLVGALLAIGWLAAAAWAAAEALRRAGELGGTVAAGALLAFVGFVVHGAGDWFWEYPPLGLPAFALFGMVLALVPARREPRSARAGGALAAGIVLMCAVAGVSYAAPWAAERDTRAAGAGWPADPLRAFERVDRAARLNPLSAGPYLTGGTIAVRRGTLGVADRYFAAALARNPGSAYAALQRGAIASALGDEREAIVLLRRAVALDPRNEVAAGALRDAERGEPVDVARLNADLLARGRAVGTG
jgi:tetratricopeptide (TPR) repeat protein